MRAERSATKRGDDLAPAREFILALFVAVIALLIRIRPLLEEDRFGLLGYDEAAYFVGARALTLGYVPYRDFVHIQPPGVLLVLAPFSFFGTNGFVAAKIIFAVLGAINTLLVWRLARLFADSVGALVAAAIYACLRVSISSHEYLLIEPLVTVAALSGIILYLQASSRPVRRWPDVCGGVCFAAALACKLFAIVPIAAFAIALPRSDWASARVRRLIAGLTGASLVIFGPFIALGPGRFWRLVVSAQAGRARETGWAQRILDSFWLAGRPPHTLDLVAAVSVSAILVGLLAWGWTRPSRVGRLCATWLLLGTLLILAAPQYFDHYAEIVAPPLAVLVGAALTAGVKDRIKHRSKAAMLQGGCGAVVFAGCLSMALAPLPTAFFYSRHEFADNAEAVTNTIPKHDCVVSDAPELALTAPNTLAYSTSGGVTVDPFAAAVEQRRIAPLPPRTFDRFVTALSRCRWFATSPYRSARVRYPGWTAQMQTWFRAKYTMKPLPGMELWKRTGPR